MDRSAPAVVRVARSDDAEAIADLLGELGYPADARAVTERLARAAGERDVTLVAERGGETAAVASVHLIPLLHEDAFLARITAFVVGELHRRCGVGSALIQACEAWAAAKGAERAEVTSAEHREGAHRFYAERGFERQGVRFTKLL